MDNLAEKVANIERQFSGLKSGQFLRGDSRINNSQTINFSSSSYSDKRFIVFTRKYKRPALVEFIDNNRLEVYVPIISSETKTFIVVQGYTNYSITVNSTMEGDISVEQSAPY